MVCAVICCVRCSVFYLQEFFVFFFISFLIICVFVYTSPRGSAGMLVAWDGWDCWAVEEAARFLTFPCVFVRVVWGGLEASASTVLPFKALTSKWRSWAGTSPRCRLDMLAKLPFPPPSCWVGP